jgi:hypothetical protein
VDLPVLQMEHGHHHGKGHHAHHHSWLRCLKHAMKVRAWHAKHSLQVSFSRSDWSVDNVVRSLKPVVNTRVFADVASLLWNIVGLGQAPQALPCYRQAVWQALPWQAWPQQARKGVLVMQEVTFQIAAKQ